MFLKTCSNKEQQDRKDFMLDADLNSNEKDVVRDPIRVILVDDHELARHGVRKILSGDASIEVVGEAENSCGAISLITRLQPEVVILDIRLRQSNGIEVSRAIKRLAPNTRILVLTAYDDNQYIVSLVKLGVNGYLIKTSSADEVIRAVHYAAKGWIVFSPEIADKLTNLLRKNGRGSFGEARGNARGHKELPEVLQGSESLTARETEVLEHLFHGLKNSDIADAMGIAQKTVEIHMHRILLKLGAKNRTQVILKSLRLGYLQGIAVPAGPAAEDAEDLTLQSHTWRVPQKGVEGTS